MKIMDIAFEAMQSLCIAITSRLVIIFTQSFISPCFICLSKLLSSERTCLWVLMFLYARLFFFLWWSCIWVYFTYVAGMIAGACYFILTFYSSFINIFCTCVMCMNVYLFAYVCVCRCICVYMLLEARGWHWTSFFITQLLILLRKGLSLESGACLFCESSYSVCPEPWGYTKATTPTWHLCGYWEAEFWSSHLHDNCFTDWAITPAPLFIFY